MASVREYAILYTGARLVGDQGAGLLGGNAILDVPVHALDGPSHTGQLPLSRISTPVLDTTLVVGPDGLGGLELRVEAGGASGRWEVLMASGITDPPDPVVSTDGTNWLYGFVPG